MSAFAEMRARAQRVLRAGTGRDHDACRETGYQLARDVLALTDLAEAERNWAQLATTHRKRGEWTAAGRAADVADHLRFYRLTKRELGTADPADGEASE